MVARGSRSNIQAGEWEVQTVGYRSIPKDVRLKDVLHKRGIHPIFGNNCKSKVTFENRIQIKSLKRCFALLKK